MPNESIHFKIGSKQFEQIYDLPDNFNNKYINIYIVQQLDYSQFFKELLMSNDLYSEKQS